MRIHKAGTETRHEVTSSKGKTDTSARFARILEVRRKELIRQFDLPPDNQSIGTAAATRQPGTISSASESIDLERLAAEIVDHLTTHQAQDVVSVEIQFNSQTLHGLAVSVRSEEGQVAINFQTAVPRLASLLQSNIGNLRSALESKGVRVSQVIVSRRTG